MGWINNVNNEQINKISKSKHLIFTFHHYEDKTFLYLSDKKSYEN